MESAVILNFQINCDVSKEGKKPAWKGKFEYPRNFITDEYNDLLETWYFFKHQQETAWASG